MVCGSSLWPKAGHNNFPAKQFFGNRIQAAAAVENLFGQLFYRKQLSGIILIRFEEEIVWDRELIFAMNYFCNNQLQVLLKEQERIISEQRVCHGV